MAWYPEPDVNNETLIDIMQYVNSTTSGFFGVAILIFVFAIFYVPFSIYKPEIALPSASAITAISSVFLLVMGLVSGYVVAVAIVLVLGSVFMYHPSRN